MSETNADRLFDEFADAYMRDDRPDVGEYLERAGAERDDLGRMLDRFLQAVPARAPSEEEVVLIRARLEQQPPLLILRVLRKVPREAVAEALLTRLGLDSAKRDKVAGYYHELEVGTLDPNPVSSLVWDVLSDVLRANARALAGPRPEAVPSAEVFLRETRYLASWGAGVDSDQAEPEQLEPPQRTRPSKPTPERAPPARDEIDRLFTGGA